MKDNPRSLLQAILKAPDDRGAHLRVLREMVAERLDATESARETASLARVVLDVEAALAALNPAAQSPVDELLNRRAKRGAK